MQIKISEDLWSCSMLPEGALERWRVREGDHVLSGAPVADVRIEQALHEILSPCSGRLTAITPVNAVVEPGDVIGEIEPCGSASP